MTLDIYVIAMDILLLDNMKIQKVDSLTHLSSASQLSLTREKLKESYKQNVLKTKIDSCRDHIVNSEVELSLYWRFHRTSIRKYVEVSCRRNWSSKTRTIAVLEIPSHLNSKIC
jgi:hypothetical protein